MAFFRIKKGIGGYMAHQAIYRKWRPMVFEDIVGQGHITQTLKNQILNDKSVMLTYSAERAEQVKQLVQRFCRVQ